MTHPMEVLTNKNCIIIHLLKSFVEVKLYILWEYVSTFSSVSGNKGCFTHNLCRIKLFIMHSCILAFSSRRTHFLLLREMSRKRRVSSKSDVIVLYRSFDIEVLIWQRPWPSSVGCFWFTANVCLAWAHVYCVLTFLQWWLENVVGPLFLLKRRSKNHAPLSVLSSKDKFLVM